MIHLTQKSDCCGCGGCGQICPQDCIEYQRDEEGFLYPHVDSSRCIQCGLCEAVCPMLKKRDQPLAEKQVFACRNKTLETRIASSSGGVFPLLAERVIQEGGAVFGAVAEGSHIRHRCARTPAEADAFRGSKYVQSEMGDCFRQAKALLEEGKKVLFSGTPCQIAGLKGFLRREYDSLLTVDCVCLGVPSPGVWEKYAAFRAQEAGAPIRTVSFRDKRTGFSDYSISLSFENGTDYSVPHGQDPYWKGFNSLLFLRPACHSCRFKGLSRSSDITLGDYWGVETRFPGFEDGKGVSLVITNTPAGAAAFDAIKEGTDCLSSDWEHAVSTHPSLVSSLPPSKNRKCFLERMETDPIVPLLLRQTRPSPGALLRKAGGKILRILKLRK